ncbi:MAG TPA: hypothetical protein VH597_08005 [Verrucomicrobiae bacterium]|jgi:hypothetical protein|nr:hypothetical protein [Verrucomicrobiae bacterium]
MKTSLRSLIALAALSVILACCFGATESAQLMSAENLDSLAQQAASPDESQAAAAVKQLRAAGPAGLDAMFHAYQNRIEARQPANAKDADWERLRATFDSVGQQRDCYASHLYWFTDLERAKAAARASGKPILSLRLLGNLDEEYSCANSRFFRTTLYPNAEVSQYLREHFILHWQSVRPVPRITIDMGDGRRIERTITGNSIHYILDAEGNPIDALPGLYGAKAFLTELNRAVAAEQQAAKLTGAERNAFLERYHSLRLAEVRQQWKSDLAKFVPVTGPAPASSFSTSARTPDAIDAAPRAASKMAVEVPLLRAGAESPWSREQDRLTALSTDAVWQQIGALHTSEAKLDVSSIKLIKLKQPPTAADAMPRAYAKSIVETPMLRMLRNLERSIAEDTVRNEYQLHSRIHEWFANGIAPQNLNALNSKIYAELFLTPNSDAWLGLAPADVYSALDGGGLVQTKVP